MKILIACEFTGTVRRAFTDAGFNAWSCDLLPTEDGSNRHIQDDVLNQLDKGWDMLLVAHPPCTRLCNSGVRWLDEPPGKLTAEHYSDSEISAYKFLSREERLAFMWHKLNEGAELFSKLWNAPIPHIAIENPIMHKHAKTRIINYEPQAQTIQPWQFGDWETKRTCLWLRNLEPLVPPHRSLTAARKALGLGEEAKPLNRVHAASPGPDRWRERSKFFPSVAKAMAEQWGTYIELQHMEAA